jgi:hypothetical protein
MKPIISATLNQGNIDILNENFSEAATATTGTILSPQFQKDVTGNLAILNAGGVERLRTTDAGLMSAGKFQCVPLNVTGQYVGLAIWNGAASGNQNTYHDTIHFFAGNTLATGTGRIQTAAGSIPIFVVTSDVRLKENIVTVSPADSMALIEGIRVVDFDLHSDIWWEDNGLPPIVTGKRGVIADEYQIQFPDGVTRSLNDQQTDDPNGVLSVGIVHHWDLLNAVKFLKEEVDTLKAQVQSLLNP